VTNANLAITQDAVRVTNLNAEAAGANWHGSLQIPRPCSSPSTCAFEFNLRSSELNAAALGMFPLFR